MAKPKLSREDCADIRRLYADRTRRETTTTLGRLFHVTPATIRKVLDDHYAAIEDYQESRTRRASSPGGAENKMRIDVGKLTSEESLDLFIELANILTEEQLFEALQQILTREQKDELAADWAEEE